MINNKIFKSFTFFDWNRASSEPLNHRIWFTNVDDWLVTVFVIFGDNGIYLFIKELSVSLQSKY